MKSLLIAALMCLSLSGCLLPEEQVTEFNPQTQVAESEDELDQMLHKALYTMPAWEVAAWREAPPDLATKIVGGYAGDVWYEASVATRSKCRPVSRETALTTINWMMLEQSEKGQYIETATRLFIETFCHTT